MIPDPCTTVAFTGHRTYCGEAAAALAAAIRGLHAHGFRTFLCGMAVGFDLAAAEAVLDHNLHMLALKTDNLIELTYAERKRVHNLKYYTWVEQQGKTTEELNALWYDTEGTWDAVHQQVKELDELINEFNEASGVLKAL